MGWAATITTDPHPACLGTGVTRAIHFARSWRMSTINLKVNGGAHTLDIDPTTPLLYILRNDLGLQGPHFGCGLGQCGACTVIINGVATRSCVTPTSSVNAERAQ